MYNCVSLPIWIGINSSSRLKPEWPGWRVVPGRSVWETRERETCEWGGSGGSMSMRRLDVTELTSQDSHLENQRPAPSALLSHCFPIALFLSVHRNYYLLQDLSAILFCQHGRCGIFQVILLGRIFCLYFDLWDLGELLNALAEKDDCMCVFLGLEFLLFKDSLFKKHHRWDTDGKVPWCLPPFPWKEISWHCKMGNDDICGCELVHIFEGL